MVRFVPEADVSGQDKINGNGLSMCFLAHDVLYLIDQQPYDFVSLSYFASNHG